jgi:predicted MFS family arabinose efflux permease
MPVPPTAGRLVTTQSGWRNLSAALHNHDFALFTWAGMPGLVAMWAQRIGIGWLAWELTHSPAWLGAVAMADLLPAVFIAPLSGALVDRINVLRLLGVTQALTVAHAAALWILTLTGVIDIWLLFGLATLLGFNQPFVVASRHNLVPLLIPPQLLGSAIAINSICFNLARFVGPAVAGILIAWSGVEIVFLIETIAETILLVSLAFFRVRPQPKALSHGGLMSLLDDVRAGIGYITEHAGIGPILVLLTFTAVSSRPSLELLPGFADAVFQRGAEGLGWLGAAVGLGGISGALWLARRGSVQGLTAAVVGFSLSMSLALIAFAALGNFWLALVFLAMCGFSMVIAGAGTQTLLQWAVDPAMRGRVMSAYTLLYRGLPALGALAIGAAAEFVGLRVAVACAAALCALTCLWALRRKKSMARALEKPAAIIAEGPS